MNPVSILTVHEALRRPLFSDAVVAAGHDGLDRRVRWVHILEISDFETLIHGEEMILTTGIAFNSGVISPVRFLKKLIDLNASCLCIERGPYFDDVPEELVALSNEHQFPLILFRTTVRFVDITQDLHSLIINNHYRLIQDLEIVSRQFHRLTLSAKGTSNVLKLLHESTGAQVIYQPFHGQPMFVPSVSERKRKQLMHDFDFKADAWDESAAPPYTLEHGQSYALVHPVGALGQTWGFVTLVFEQLPHQYHKLLLDSASLSISQELLRSRYMEERKLYTVNLWVDELLNERLKDDEQIKAAIGPNYKSWNDTDFRVCLIEFANPELLTTNDEDNNQEASYFHISMIVRSSFEKYAFQPLITVKNNRIAVIALDMRATAPEKTRMEQALEMVHAQTGERLNGLKLLSGAGNRYKKLKHAVASYEEATKALSLHETNNRDIIFYEELGIYQLLLDLNDREALQTYVNTHLGSIIEHDRKKNSKLLLTLKVFLDCDCSKQAAAQKLFVVRQSLYYRLDQINELLGTNFRLPDQRLTVQVALRAHQLLHPGAFDERQ